MQGPTRPRQLARHPQAKDAGTAWDVHQHPNFPPDYVLFAQLGSELSAMLLDCMMLHFIITYTGHGQTAIVAYVWLRETPAAHQHQCWGASSGLGALPG